MTGEDVRAGLTLLMLGVSYTMYALLVVNATAAVGLYLRVQHRNRHHRVLRPDGVLPSHVIDVGIAVVLLATEAVAFNILLDPGWKRTIIVCSNVALFAFANQSIFIITHYEYRRFAAEKPRPATPFNGPE